MIGPEPLMCNPHRASEYPYPAIRLDFCQYSATQAIAEEDADA
jgi:hypothetical protein